MAVFQWGQLGLSGKWIERLCHRKGRGSGTGHLRWSGSNLLNSVCFYPAVVQSSVDSILWSFYVTGCLIVKREILNGSEGYKDQYFIELWCLVASRGLDIWDSSTSFQKNSIGWPQQPLTAKVSDISEKLDFWWSIPQKGVSISYFGTRNDPTIRISKLFDEMRLSRSLRPLRLLMLLRSLRPLRF